MFDFEEAHWVPHVTLAVSWLLYKKFYRPSAYAELSSALDDNSFGKWVLAGSSRLEDQWALSTWYHSSTHRLLAISRTMFIMVTLFSSTNYPTGLLPEPQRSIAKSLNTSDHRYRPYNYLALIAFLLTAASWVYSTYTTPRWSLHRQRLICMGIYVLGHFFVPLFTAIWLYVFHAPGALKLFSSFKLGMQNIAGVLTHLCFQPSPWFIHSNRPDYKYDMPGMLQDWQE